MEAEYTFNKIKDRLNDVKQHKSEHKPSPEILLSTPRAKVKTVLKFCHTHFLRPKRICLGIGPIGAGKSNLSEAIVSSHLNPHVDTFKMEVTPDPDNRPLLLIDFERTADEILDGCDRILRRIAIDNNPELRTEERFKNTFIHGFLRYSKTEDKVNELKHLVAKYQPYLLILDGAASLVYDVNDTRESVSTVAELLSIADINNLAIFCTVHPNPGQQNDFKPRGTFGSELLRQAESVLLLKRAPDDRDTRILTTSFMHGKNRSANDNLETYFRWNDREKMFMSCDYTPTVKSSKAEKQEEVIVSILTDSPGMSYKDLTAAIVAKAGNSIPTAGRWIEEATKRELIFKVNGLYKLHPF
jgi:hypothetical protein